MKPGNLNQLAASPQLRWDEKQGWEVAFGTKPVPSSLLQSPEVSRTLVLLGLQPV